MKKFLKSKSGYIRSFGSIIVFAVFAVRKTIKNEERLQITTDNKIQMIRLETESYYWIRLHLLQLLHHLQIIHYIE